MRPRSLLVPVISTLLSSASAFLSEVPSLDPRQISCNESGVWSEWGQNCCGESACPPSVSCTAGEEGCTSSKITLSITWTQITTTTITPEHTQTIYSSGGTSGLVSTGSVQSSTPEITMSSPNGTYSTNPCSSGTSVGTSSQDSAPPNPPPSSPPSPPPSPPPCSPPTVPTTNTSSTVSCTDHSTPQTSYNIDTTATPLDTSKPANSDATGSTSAATGTINKPSITTNIGSMTSSSSSLSSSSTHHSTTTSITSFTGSSGAERPLVAMASVAVVLSLVIMQAVLL